MNSKSVLISFFFLACQTVTVKKEDLCTDCSQMKSERDCQNFHNCTWMAASSTSSASCNLAVPHPVVLVASFCEMISNLECSTTYGCAYYNGKCIHFAGCSAYEIVGCTTVSNRCILDGSSCIEKLACQKYTKEQCGKYQNNKLKLCIWDDLKQACRELQCQEAEISFRTDEQCKMNISNDCITTGAGCIQSALPKCSELRGPEEICQKLKGSDGKCESNPGTNNCRVKVCSNAPVDYSNNADCNSYQTGCITTGKGCTSALGLCSSYTPYNAAADCLGYIGSDGKCIGDHGNTACRAMTCEEITSGRTNEFCNSQKAGCITNGKSCVSSLSYCSTYTGTVLSCEGYLGIDGNCKGMSQVDSPCSPKDCVIDSTSQFSTDIQCQDIQQWCKSTGNGCVTNLQPCSQYTFSSLDGSECLNKRGSDGNCKAGIEGHCTQKICSEASIAKSSNKECRDYQEGCVTTGQGCIQETVCEETLKEISCQGTFQDSSACSWNQSCIDNSSCSSFHLQLHCITYQALYISEGGRQVTQVTTPCIWESNLCRNARCEDFQETNDQSCSAALAGCVTNGIGCTDPNDCSNFIGTANICLGFKAYCTNTDSAPSTAMCIARSCSDSGLTYSTDEDCNTYLPGCLTKGNGCISDTVPCSGYFGTTAQCDLFQGYVNSTIRARCWNTSSSASPCVEKTCIHANAGMTSDEDCGYFLRECLYNGNGGCVHISSTCSAYYGNQISCQTFRGSNGANQCYYTTDFGSGQCTEKLCFHNTTATTDSECNTFFPGCLTKGLGCIDPASSCSLYSGTPKQCNSFTGNKIKCTRLETCQDKMCSEYNNATSNSDCLAYHQKCRIKQGTSICIVEQATCLAYASFATTATTTDKQLYCNQITILDNITPCAFNPEYPSNCVARTCNLWTQSLPGISCIDYTGTNSCRQANDDFCYSPSGCTVYIIPEAPLKTVAERISWCNNMTDISRAPLRCTYDPSGNSQACKAITQCEEIISPQSAAYCNAYLNSGLCQYYDGKCYTTEVTCTAYVDDKIINIEQFCSNLKQNNSGSVTMCQKHSSDNYCIAMTCSNITSPKKQEDCNQMVSGCKYFLGGCYEIKHCTSYDLLDLKFQNTEKRLFCQNMYNYGTTEYCSYNENDSTCSDPEDCETNHNINITEGDPGVFCQIRRNRNGQICDWSEVFFNGSYYYSIQCGLASANGQENLCRSDLGEAINDEYCDLRTTPNICLASNNKCVSKAVESCTLIEVLDQSIGVQVCQQKVDYSGAYCSYNQDTSCDNPKVLCLDWIISDASQDNTAYCKKRIDKTGALCSYSFGDSSCRRYLTCEDAVNPESQTDCDSYMIGCTYSTGHCYVPANNCQAYKAFGANNNEKLQYCKELITLTQGECTYLLEQANCINKGPCVSYVVEDLEQAPPICSSIETSDTYGCTYWSGKTCTPIGACSSYIGAGVSGSIELISKDCSALKDSLGTPCLGSTINNGCYSPNQCESITGALSQSDCDKYLINCLYYSSKCYTISNSCNYNTGGIEAIVFCNSMRTSLTGDYCKAQTDESQYCQIRTCNDVIYKTHYECQAYLSHCKSNGLSCIESNINCAAQSENPSLCQWVLDIDNISTCNIDTTTECVNRICSENVMSTTDQECNAYLNGCRTKGIGCISPKESCTSYYGTTEMCKEFVGNNIKCWGDSLQQESACRNRTCSDNSTAKLDQDCEEFLPGCLTTGSGCVDQSMQCQAYRGTQDTCKHFKGSNNTVLCWNSPDATALTACTNKQCSDLQSSSDSDCSKFLPATEGSAQNCVTNGTTCVSYPRNCSDFYGNQDTCQKFTAADGPCKATSNTKVLSTCTPRICSEALNTLNTDILCQAYHPSCVTTGRGCIKAINGCHDIQTSDICGIKIGCVWAHSCRQTPKTCSELTSNGSSICVNTSLQDGTKCAWSQGICRAFKCTDYDNSLTSHEQCSVLNSNCTTNGAGCILIDICRNYKISSICAAAVTMEPSKRCTWDKLNGVCRERQCEDLAGISDEDCDKLLPGCKTSGSRCIGSTYDCSVFNGNRKFCKRDSSNNPCHFVNNICYKFSGCLDASVNTLKECQEFSEFCVPSRYHCISIRSCEKYQSRKSCIKGLSNTTCAWSNNGKCELFIQCENFNREGSQNSITNKMCRNYNSRCFFDEQSNNCAPIRQCNQYLTQDACRFNYNYEFAQETNVELQPQDKCVWEHSTSTCRIKRCSDLIETTDEKCAAYIVRDQDICTTNGTKCVPRSKCVSYLNRQSCTIGDDGIPCIFSYPIAQTPGMQLCRAKVCSDFSGATNHECANIFNNSNCVSNGKFCVSKDLCSNYKSNLECNGGGTDGDCIFTSGSKCELLISCKQFQDEITCSSKQETCKWGSNKEQEMSCMHKTCELATSGQTCNPVPSLDGKSFNICVSNQNICKEGDPSDFSSKDCLISSLKTYSWNYLTSKCERCVPQLPNITYDIIKRLTTLLIILGQFI